MSGGHWNYQSHAIEDLADKMHELLIVVAKTEHALDWAICADTTIEDAKDELWRIWEAFFDRNSFKTGW